MSRLIRGICGRIEDGFTHQTIKDLIKRHDPQIATSQYYKRNVSTLGHIISDLINNRLINDFRDFQTFLETQERIRERRIRRQYEQVQRESYELNQYRQEQREREEQEIQRTKERRLQRQSDQVQQQNYELDQYRQEQHDREEQEEYNQMKQEEYNQMKQARWNQALDYWSFVEEQSKDRKSITHTVQFKTELKQRAQLESFMNQHKSLLGYSIKSIPNKYDMLMINTSIALEKNVGPAIHQMEQAIGQRYKTEEVITNDITEPVAIYQFNRISSWEKIMDAFEKVLNYNRNIPGVKTFKIAASFSLLLQKEKKIPEPGYIRIGNGLFVIYFLSSYNENKSSLIPFMFNLLQFQQYKQKFEDYLHTEVASMFEFHIEDSSTSYIAITGVEFVVYRIKNAGAKLMGFDELVRNHDIYACLRDSRTCVLENIVIAQDPERYKKMNGDRRKIDSAIKRVYWELFRQDYSEERIKDGVEIISTLTTAAKLYNIDFALYTYDKKTKHYEQFEIIESDKEGEHKKANLILLSEKDNEFLHVMYAKNIEKVAGIHICPKCGLYTAQASDNNNNYRPKRFEEHVKKCDGKFHQSLRLNKIPKPDATFLQKNPVFAYLYAHDRKEEYKPVSDYMLYDFETVCGETNTDLNTNKTTFLGNLEPITVAWLSSINNIKQTHSLYRDNKTVSEFIDEWLNIMFEEAKPIYESRNEWLMSLNPDTNKLNDKDVKNVKVLGFNSRKFDVNLFVSCIEDPRIKIASAIGSSTQYKSLQLSHTDYDFHLQFLDLQLFTGPGDLRSIAKKFNKEIKKGNFAYDAITTSNYQQELAKSEPFTYEQFYNSLTKSNISTDDYNEYKQEQARLHTRLEYLIYYNELDVKIMAPVVDALVQRFANYNVDMLRNFSLSSAASQVRLSFAYKDFDIHTDYNNVEKKETPYYLDHYAWTEKVNGYIKQDKAAKRNHENNVCEDDYEYYRNLFLTSKCHMCQARFSWNNKPTLDRLDNNIGHTKENVLPCCNYCNTCKSNRDEETARLFIQLRKYALLNNLPMTLGEGDEDLYHMTRNGITGGLSNVHNRFNIKGKSTIKNLKFEDNKVKIIETFNVITHVLGIDFNSLYPSMFAGIIHEFNPYTDHTIYMPGYTKYRTKDKELMRKIINAKKELFIVSLKGHCSDIDKVINFPPIIRNVEFQTSKDIIGETMYDYMKKHNMPVDRKVRKLTQLTDTHGEYMVFSSYYLWFLIDTCGFVIDDVKDMYVFTKHRAFNGFVEEFMRKRQEAKLSQDDIGDTFYKICLNSSYGYDILNKANFTHSKFCDKAQTFASQISAGFVSTRKLGEDKYQVQYVPRTFSCDTTIIPGFFTLDNAKYWYLNFIYNFMYKCLDMSRIHFVEGDTDSMYFAISGDPNDPEGNNQGFKHVIKNKEFYNENVYKFLPSNFYSTATTKPTFNTKLEQQLFDKKLGGLAIEKHCDSMIALAPKMYSCINNKADDIIPVESRVKGVRTVIKEKEIRPEHYINAIQDKAVLEGSVSNLQLIKGIMSKIELRKNFITAAHTKYQVSNDFSTCVPLFHSLN
jgi:hypothetical protein